MKKVARVKLVVTDEQGQLLSATLSACNAAANQVSIYARTNNEFDGRKLQVALYRQIKDQVGGAQSTLQTIRKVSGAYKSHKTNLKHGNYGKPGTARHERAAAKVITFRAGAAQAFDDRILRWYHQDREVSIWTLQGRIRVGFIGSASQMRAIAQHRKGESDLMQDRDGDFYLTATLDIAEPAPAEPADFIGVDMGINTIAAISDTTGGHQELVSGAAVQLRRRKNNRMRKRLQTKATRSAKRVLRRQAGKEAKFTQDVNHQISKKIVTEAQRTGYGISMEDLAGIRKRVRQHRPQRVTMTRQGKSFSSWSFAQLRDFITYKALQAGVEVVVVNPAYTSQMCHGCGHVEKQNRPSQAEFCCLRCGLSLHADLNAAINIAQAGVMAWGDRRIAA